MFYDQREVDIHYGICPDCGTPKSPRCWCDIPEEQIQIMPQLFLSKDGKHYHRCENCGILHTCNQNCTKGGEFDPYDETDIDQDGCLPGGRCDSICYNEGRPKGCQKNMTTDGKIVDFPPF